MDFLKEIKEKNFKVDMGRVNMLLEMPDLFNNEYMIID